MPLHLRLYTGGATSDEVDLASSPSMWPYISCSSSSLFFCAFFASFFDSFLDEEATQLLLPSAVPKASLSFLWKGQMVP